MRVILDTNVLVSAIFFKGIPGRILNAWHNRAFELVVSVEILEEYDQVVRELAVLKNVDAIPIIEQIALRSEIWDVPPLMEEVCEDPDDDMFLACALIAGVDIIVSGDKALLALSGYRKLSILSPRQFLQMWLPEFA